ADPLQLLGDARRASSERLSRRQADAALHGSRHLQRHEPNAPGRGILRDGRHVAADVSRSAPEGHAARRAAAILTVTAARTADYLDSEEGCPHDQQYTLQGDLAYAPSTAYRVVVRHARRRRALDVLGNALGPGCEDARETGCQASRQNRRAGPRRRDRRSPE